jgi:uncharacterized protein (TIRG00374 family)
MMLRINNKYLLVISFGFLLSIISITWVLHKVEYDQFVDAFLFIKLDLIFFAFISTISSFIFRAERWRLINNGGVGDRNKYIKAVGIGVFFNFILPLRAGEIARIYSLAKLTHTKITNNIAASLCDRFLDFFILFLFLCFIFFTLPSNALIRYSIFFTATLIAFAVIFMFFLVYFFHSFENFILKIFRIFLKDKTAIIKSALMNLNNEIKSFKLTPLNFYFLFIISAIIIFDISSIFFIFYAFNLKAALMAPVVFWIFFVLGSMAPSLPGNLGINQAGLIIAMSIFELTSSLTLAMALVTQLIPAVISILISGFDFEYLKKIANYVIKAIKT